MALQSNPSTTTANYVRNIVEKYTSAGKTPRTIEDITQADPAVVTTDGDHNLTNDDIIKDR